LTDFVGKAKKSLWIYDPKINDGAIVRVLEDRVRKGVDVRVLGSVGKRAKSFRADTMKALRLHARVIIRDGREVFFGSQSLRTAELDGRREVGIIVKDPKIVKAVTTVFEKDWSETKVAKAEQEESDEMPAEAVSATA
jgi:phosphatidylserine/phosphatidylglycerophosphate/cardiolipin synthase-like enzyme